jgi:phage shock protein A
MTSLWSQATTWLGGSMHDLLDEVTNTPSAYRQRIRQVEEALADLRAASDEQRGTALQNDREREKLESLRKQHGVDIDRMVGNDDPTDDAAALALEVEVGELDQRIARLTQLAQAAEANRAKLQTAIRQLEAKHREMSDKLADLTMSQAVASAQNRASGAVEAAVASTAGIDSGSIDSLTARIEHDQAVADARFERVVGEMASQQSPQQAADLAAANERLAARRARIADAAKQQATQPA